MVQKITVKPSNALRSYISFRIPRKLSEAAVGATNVGPLLRDGSCSTEGHWSRLHRLQMPKPPQAPDTRPRTNYRIWVALLGLVFP